MRALDSVQHLMHKLTSIGLKGNVLKWIKSFRTEQVVLNEKNPAKNQSLVVSLNLKALAVFKFFLFYNLPSIVSSPIFMFADDTKIIISSYAK